MTRLEELLAQLRDAQETAVERQGRVTAAVNEALAGGVGGLAQVADALDSLRSRQMPAIPSPVQANDPPEGSAVSRSLELLVESQLAATDRNSRVADAVNAAVAGGVQSVSGVAEGLRLLCEAPTTPGGSLLDLLRQARNATSSGDSLVGGTSPERSLSTRTVRICPTCARSGQVFSP